MTKIGISSLHVNCNIEEGVKSNCGAKEIQEHPVWGYKNHSLISLNQCPSSLL